MDGRRDRGGCLCDEAEGARNRTMPDREICQYRQKLGGAGSDLQSDHSCGILVIHTTYSSFARKNS